MKRLATLFTVMIALAWLTGTANAEPKRHRGMMGGGQGQGMMGGGQGQGMEQMMGQMMPQRGAEEASYGEGPFDLDAMKDRLKLTDDQMSKLKKLRSGYTKEMIKRRAAVRVAELDLFELLDAKTLDMEAAEKQVKELGAIQSDLWLYRIKALKETSRFLTEDQFEMFREMGFKFMRKMMGGGRHGG